MKLFEVADQYCKESTWKTMAAVKFCLFSIGIIVGVLLPETCQTPVLVIFGIVFYETYIPVLRQFFKHWTS